MTAVRRALAGISFFDPFLPEDLERLVAAGRFEPRPAGSVIFRQHDPADRLYIVLEGTVEISLDQGPQHLALTQLGPGEFFGELALIDGGTRSATVTTLTPCQLFLLDREDFLRLFTGSPPFLARLLEGLSAKVRNTTEKLFREELVRRLALAEAETARHRSIVQMVTGIAHELNTPLGNCTTALSLAQEWLKAEPLCSLAAAPASAAALADLREVIGLLDHNLARATALIDTFSAISDTANDAVPQTVDLALLVRETVDFFLLQQRPHGVRLVCTAPAGPTPWFGRRTALVRVLMPLLTNIVDHALSSDGADQEGPHGLIELASAEAGAGAGAGLGLASGWRLSVRDFGPGIAPEHLPQACDAFFTTARTRGHKGLGLAIAAHLASGPLQGRLVLAAADGGGTCVTLFLPRQLG